MMISKKSKKIVVGNWKMNPVTLTEAKKNFESISAKKINNKILTVVCPPIIFLSELKKGYRGGILFGAQDVSTKYVEDGGSFTGEISAEMVKNLGAKYVIVGHSERRALGETNEAVSKKVAAALKMGLKVILCVGEKERDNDGKYLNILKDEIKISLKNVEEGSVGDMVIAYEPIWAIGERAGGAISSHELHQMMIFIKKTLIEEVGKWTAEIPVIYGGSVATENAAELVKDGKADGLLVGRESLKAENFLKICDSISSLELK